MSQGTRTRRLAPPTPAELRSQDTLTTMTEITDTAPVTRRKTGPRNDPRKGKNAHIRKAGVFLKIADRLQKSVHGHADGRSNEMDDWCEHEVVTRARDAATSAIASLREAAQMLDALGEDFEPVPRRGVARAKPLDEGTRISVKAAFMERHADLLTEAVAKNLVVERCVGTRIIARDPNGGRVIIPRRDVEVITS